jgi:hypothetical protein
MHQYVEAVECQRLYFISHAYLNKDQSNRLGRVLNLFQKAKAPKATESRRKSAKELLLNILNTLGESVFILCILANSITTLASIRPHVRFVQELDRWWKSTERPENLVFLLHRDRVIPDQMEAHRDERKVMHFIQALQRAALERIPSNSSISISEDTSNLAAVEQCNNPQGLGGDIDASSNSSDGSDAGDENMGEHVEEPGDAERQFWQPPPARFRPPRPY